MKRLFSTTPANPPKGPWERLRDWLLFRPGAPSWANYPGKEGASGFRTPSPGSQRPANIPTVTSTESLYNTQYYTRDTRRNPPAKIVSLHGTSYPLLEAPEVSMYGSSIMKALTDSYRLDPKEEKILQ